MKRWLCAILSLSLILALCACSASDGPAEETGKVAQTEPSGDALWQFRGDMKPPVIAVADFGFPDLSENFDIMDYLRDEYPKWLEKTEFLRDIPETQIVRTCGFGACAQLVCVVPRDPDSTVTVSMMSYEDMQEQELYHSESGEPILLLADISEEIRITVQVVDSEGRGVSWQPYWGNYDPIPENGYYGGLVMDFSPLPDKTAYDRHVDSGWFAPELSQLADGLWQSDYGWQLELDFEPGEIYDGGAYLYEDNGDGIFECRFTGNWRYAEGMLYLTMSSVRDEALTVEGDFPVLTDPWQENWLGICRSADGSGLPHFFEDLELDELYPVTGNQEDPYQYALNEGWRVPELWELEETFWLSWCGYALELMDDSVPGNNGGLARLYDVGEIGEYTASYNGSWTYENGLLYLSLVPLQGDGYLVDDSFPVLTRDGDLWIGRSHNGTGLPHFGFDLLADILEQPKG